MERLSIDFKGPLPSSSKNKYILTVVDEFSRFPFAFPCSNMESRTVISCLMQIFHLFGACGYIHSDRGRSFISQEFVSFMHNLRIPTSKTSVYNPASNGQCEKYNDIIWSGIKLALKDQNLPISKWEVVLPQVLRSVRSLLCTATNSTPHERLFGFQRRSILGISTPSWLCSPGTVLVRRHVRHNKYEPLVEEADLIHATPQYAHIRFKNGRESTVSLRDVAPVPDSGYSNQSWHETIPPEPEEPIHDGFSPDENASTHHEHEILTPKLPDEEEKSLRRESNSDTPKASNDEDSDQVVLRRSKRTRKAPDRLTYYN